MRVIGLTGHAQHGKNTVAGLIEEFADAPVRHLAFADSLREFVSRQNPIVSDDGLRYNDAVRYYGYEDAKAAPDLDVRRLLQVTGTEAARYVFGEDVWVTALERRLLRMFRDDAEEDGIYVITDVRFPNEAAWLLENGGDLWGVVRTDDNGIVYESPGVSREHPSEKHVTSLLTQCGQVFIAPDLATLRAEVKVAVMATVNGTEEIATVHHLASWRERIFG